MKGYIRIFESILASGFVGIFTALIIYILYDNNIVIQEFIKGSLTISQLMSIIVIIWVMVGVLIGVARS